MLIMGAVMTSCNLRFISEGRLGTFLQATGKELSEGVSIFTETLCNAESPSSPLICPGEWKRSFLNVWDPNSLGLFSWIFLRSSESKHWNWIVAIPCATQRVLSKNNLSLYQLPIYSNLLLDSQLYIYINNYQLVYVAQFFFYSNGTHKLRESFERHPIWHSIMWRRPQLLPRASCAIWLYLWNRLFIYLYLHTRTYFTLIHFSGQCRLICRSKADCVAASASMTNTSRTLCRLAKEGPLDTTLVDNPEATYIFWKGLVSILKGSSIFCSLI